MWIVLGGVAIGVIAGLLRIVARLNRQLADSDEIKRRLNSCVDAQEFLISALEAEIAETKRQSDQYKSHLHRTASMVRDHLGKGMYLVADIPEEPTTTEAP
ncbi:hypothetical protein SH668x_001247 [Planctomicrobium sp. SH668]|uniref:hypothetical protein n=1 Tax=Planctomicrobium sp. SH668 TaxID=3448126 RepID=UPI003F5B02BF